MCLSGYLGRGDVVTPHLSVSRLRAPRTLQILVTASRRFPFRIPACRITRVTASRRIRQHNQPGAVTAYRTFVAHPSTDDAVTA